MTGIEVEQELRKLNHDWVEALLHRDAETLNRIMAEDFVFTYPLEGDDREQFISDVVSGDLRVETLSRENISVRVFGMTAIVTARDTTKWFYSGREIAGQYRILSVFSFRSEQWQLVAIQACPIA